MIIFLTERLPCVRHSKWFINMNSFELKLLVEMRRNKTQLEKQMPGNIKTQILLYIFYFLQFFQFSEFSKFAS